eukprot:TRINITY_DN6478_c0_g1_i1.p1 TRINITY_DN6478_c0_g1~~TRINITY_DN6478_c0_g1_i1.p1  ORF type:complete len:305 (-),score=62.18 TRINITY_DN6478_c0_g1_i1:142-942(-)
MSGISTFSEPKPPVNLLQAKDAIKLDEELMTSPGFSIDQLMELAGLSVACSVAKVYSPSKVLVVCGPGNNGGDGLVAARHLFHFGYEPVVYYPKRTSKPIYTNLVHQLDQLNVPIVPDMPGPAELKSDFNFILDCIFGFSFSGAVRPPFDSVIAAMVQSGVPIASVDIPSGWDVNEGNTSSIGDTPSIEPDVLISLTAPKPCSRLFKGRHHFLGGRFLPPKLAQKYGLTWLPRYWGTEQCVEFAGDLGGSGASESTCAAAAAAAGL